jgi:hypothetical protein
MMNFIEKARSLNLGQKVASAAGLLGAACIVSSLFGTGAWAAQAPTNPTSYVGIWKMTAQDKRVGTLELMNYNGLAALPMHTLFRVRLLLSKQAFHKACS